MIWITIQLLILIMYSRKSPYGHFSNMDSFLCINKILTNLTFLLRTLQGPGVDSLRYIPFPVSGYTNIDTN